MVVCIVYRLILETDPSLVASAVSMRGAEAEVPFAEQARGFDIIVESFVVTSSRLFRCSVRYSLLSFANMQGAEAVAHFAEQARAFPDDAHFLFFLCAISLRCIGAGVMVSCATLSAQFGAYACCDR